MRAAPGLGLGALLVAPLALGAQASLPRLILDARAQVAARHLDSADVLLAAVLDTAAHATSEERENALVLRAIVAFARGDDTLTRVTFREALALDTGLAVKGLADISPRLAQIFGEEKEAATRLGLVYVAGHVDESPRRTAGPPVAYTTELLRRHVAGVVEVSVIIDTLGRAEPASVRIEQLPDSGLAAPVTEMVLASRFSPGRHHGRVVRVMTFMQIPVQPPRLVATELVTAARTQLAGRHTDSAFTLLGIALDTAITRATDGERAYALLVRGIAWSQVDRDSLATVDFSAALASYNQLLDRGIALAPFLRRLGDSVEQGRRGGVIARLAAPMALAPVDEQPTVVSHPPIRYPPEMRTLGASGTVIVEATLEATGRVEPASVRIVQSANPGFNDEVRRIVRAALYRPAKSRGRPVRVVIRQALTFAGY